ncbi:unnamed protein product [Tuber melanosporum]|uniref:(Perigord truffle) hypothetical protein n=1 Tax=Tuber melanosporum (strain Mel28) TaxID=656061 RepID=D5GCH2_TUBMM|nr:uncharacterized protein GSTUM_00005888001 [Tuber melanosporum]CAZ82215.1 unnamed protein product [Tuber melanosporum]
MILYRTVPCCSATPSTYHPTSSHPHRDSWRHNHLSPTPHRTPQTKPNQPISPSPHLSYPPTTTKITMGGGGKIPYSPPPEPPLLTNFHRKLPKTRLVSQRRLVFSTQELENQYRDHGHGDRGHRGDCLEDERGAGAQVPHARSWTVFSKPEYVLSRSVLVGWGLMGLIGGGGGVRWE